MLLKLCNFELDELHPFKILILTQRHRDHEENETKNKTKDNIFPFVFFVTLCDYLF